jgi:hypothetical protein
VKPSEDSSQPSLSPSPIQDVPRAAPEGVARAQHNGDGAYVGYASPLMVRLEAYERRTGKSFPRDRRGGWRLTPDQLAAIEEAPR